MAHSFAALFTKRKAANYHDQICKGLRYVIISTQSECRTEESLPSHSSDSSSWKSSVSVGVVFKKLFANMTPISQVEQDEDVELFDADP